MIKKSARPPITASESLRLLFHRLAMAGKTVLAKEELVSCLYKHGGEPSTNLFLSDISFCKAPDFLVSPDIDAALAEFLVFGEISTLEPDFGKIIITVDTSQDPTREMESRFTPFVAAADEIVADMKKPSR